jgi:hypothetical protein
LPATFKCGTEIPHFQLAQLLAAQRVIQQGRQDGAIALVLDRAVGRRGEQVAHLVVTDRRRLGFAALGPGPLDAFDRLWVTAFFSQRYSNSDDSSASRCRTVAPPSARLPKSSRQAMTWARVTVRNSSGRLMPVKRMKSWIAVS